MFFIEKLKSKSVQYDDSNVDAYFFYQWDDIVKFCNENGVNLWRMYIVKLSVLSSKFLIQEG